MAVDPASGAPTLGMVLCSSFSFNSMDQHVCGEHDTEKGEPEGQ